MQGVTLSLAPGALLNASFGSRLLLEQFVRSSMVLVNGSTGTVIKGGTWIGPGRGRAAVIRIQDGSNRTTVEGADISGAGWDGIIIYDVNGPSFNCSVLDSLLHDNGRYGFQEYANSTVRTMGTLVSGNAVIDNVVGGIYTNGIGGVTISDNVVRNTVGNGPGLIGIGVTNGANDTVASNQVGHMKWFGIQAFYNNHTVIANNTSTFNAGGEDQSGITNDHSSFDTIVGNVVKSNGGYGIYVERSWNVSISGNTANGNYGYGIELNHGTIPVMGLVTVVNNTCSFNELGGIILNSAVNNTISMNTCDDNPGGGILLYNDPGQLGSTGNLVSKNWACNEATLAPTQTFGIKEFSDSDDNTFASNVALNDTTAAVSLVGPFNNYSG
jgi:parallel beta-helix repeat protein